MKERLQRCRNEACVVALVREYLEAQNIEWEWFLVKNVCTPGSMIVMPWPSDLQYAQRDEFLRAVLDRVCALRLDRRLRMVWEEAGVPERYWRFRLEDFKGRGKAHVVKAVRRWLDGEMVFLTIVGAVGVGKTALAAAAVHDWVQRTGEFVLWRNWSALIVDLQAHFGDAQLDTATMQKTMIEAPLLVLDDVSAVGMTPWQQSVLYGVVNGRYERSLPLLLTSNLDEKEFAASVGMRIIDRLTEVGMGELVRMSGKNYRHEKKEER